MPSSPEKNDYFQLLTPYTDPSPQTPVNSHLLNHMTILFTWTWETWESITIEVIIT